MALAPRTTEAQALELGAEYAYITAVGISYLRFVRMVNADYATYEVVAKSDQFLAGEQFVESVDSERLTYIANTTNPDTEV